MKNLVIGLFSLFLLCLILSACQGMEEEHAAEEGVYHEEHTQHSNDEETPVGIKIEGLAHHYHTGD